MPRLSQGVPKYRKHKASGQAFVELNSYRYYLGPYGSRTSRDEYDRRIAEWLQRGRISKLTNADSCGLLVVELIAAYLKFANGYYRKAGRLTSEYNAILHAIRPVKRLYSGTPADDFGPIALQTVMARMVSLGCRPAAALLRIGPSTANRWLLKLQHDGVLELVTEGSRGRAAEYLYRPLAVAVQEVA